MTDAGSARPLRIACVHLGGPRADLVVAAMNTIRFFRIAAALARRGHEVDVLIDRGAKPVVIAPRLREVPLSGARWDRYDVVKTLFHSGFQNLLDAGGGDHPFIIAKLGSVVGHAPTPGVHFHGAIRERLFAVQTEIARRSRQVTVLTEASAALWQREHGPSRVILVPTGVDRELPPPRRNPYRELGIAGPVAIYAGHLYAAKDQPEVNHLWQARLNAVGRALRRRGVRLVVLGRGDTHLLDRDVVLHVGAIPADDYWDWQRHAQVGLVLAQGLVQHNESSKIYYYLRTALPVVCERPVPNAGLVTETRHGTLVDYDDVEAAADAAAALAARPPDANGIEDYMITHHSWDARAALYDPILAEARTAIDSRRVELRGQ